MSKIHVKLKSTCSVDYKIMHGININKEEFVELDDNESWVGDRILSDEDLLIKDVKENFTDSVPKNNAFLE